MRGRHAEIDARPLQAAIGNALISFGRDGRILLLPGINRDVDVGHILRFDRHLDHRHRRFQPDHLFAAGGTPLEGEQRRPAKCRLDQQARTVARGVALPVGVDG